ncbi:MAG: GIY-YIG nuclease family protein [Candidatus Aenigmarchaeota archaeon]|nr:GIY-YIG nuclease family protein [Candidatus Aenigmarchaeota archaeon]
MKGIYALIINLEKNIKIRVGSLGHIPFKRGMYVYVGSAQNGIEQRVKRHLKRRKKKHWHIDYLLEHANVKDVLVKKGPKNLECLIAKKLMGFSVPIKGFGCSDCNCESHLFMINKSKIKKLKMKSMVFR